MIQTTTQTKNVPKLRFPEFSGAWKLASLSGVAGAGQYGMNAAAKKFDGVNKYLRITDIDEETRRFLYKDLTSPSGIKEKKYLLEEGDIVFSRTGASTGKTYIYNKNDGKVYFAGFLIRFKVGRTANSYFTYIQTLRHNYLRWVTLTSTRSGQPGINAQEFGNYKFFLSEITEQQKIADFLTAVDERIEGLVRKIELLKKYKKGVMQKIFSQQIRFKDGNGKEFPDWEEKKFVAIYEFLKTNSLSRDRLADAGKIKNIHYGDIHVKLSTNFDSSKKTISYLTAEINSDFCQSGDLVIADASEDRIDIGKAIEIIKTNGDRIVAGLHTFLVRSISGIALGFSGYLMQSPQIRKNLWRIATGASVLGISKTELGKIVINLPRKEEQQKIADFLTSIDEKIEAEEKKLTEAKKFKKFLLQGMFV